MENINAKLEDEENILEPSRAADRRKSDWRHAVHRKKILDYHYTRCFVSNLRPLHYYAKNSVEKGYASPPNKTNNKGSRRYISKNYAPYKNYSPHDQQQVDDFEHQMRELEEE